MRLGALPPHAGPAPALTWRALAAAKTAEVEAASQKAEEARKAAVRAGADAARFVKPLRVAEGAKRRAEAQLQDAESTLENAGSPEARQRAEETKAKVLARLGEAQTQLDALKAEGQPKLDAAAAARDEARAAEAARVAAVKEASIAEANMAPVSVFISRKTQTLHIRQNFRPIFEGPVTIRDPEAPIGTTIYTALSYIDDGASMRWSALAMYTNPTNPEPAPGPKAHRAGIRQAEPAATDIAAAKAALERVSIPQETIDRVAEFVSPGSSLIISDEQLSKETSKGTDFVVLMGGEPQGGIKMRRRSSPYAGFGYGYDRPYRRSPYSNNPFGWW
jgi:hypothetical protein